MKRSLRRKAWKERKYANERAKKIINKSMLWSSMTWGGTRCPGCGVKTEPRYHLGNNLSRSFPGGHLTAFLPVCDRVRCPGEDPDWEDKLVKTLDC